MGGDHAVGGEVLDDTGAAVSGARITLISLGSNAESISTSNELGQFQIGGIKTGMYRLRVYKQGFSVFSRELDVSTVAVTSVAIRLHIGTVKDSVTVSAQRNSRDTLVTPEAVSAVQEEALDSRMPLTAVDPLRDLPGVYTQSQGFYTRPIIRGFEGNRVLVLVDGERLNNSRVPTGHVGNGLETGLIDPGMLESVEVMRGGGSVLYGTDAVGGTINFISTGMSPSPDGWRLGFDLNPYVTSNGAGGRYGGAVSVLGPKLTMRLRQSFENFGDYKAGEPAEAGYLASGRGYNAATRVLTRSGYRSESTRAEARWFASQRWMLRGGWERSFADHIAYPLQTTSRILFNERTKYRGGATWRGPRGIIQQLQLSGYWQNQNRRDQSISQSKALFQVADSLRYPVDRGLDAQINLTPSPRHVITAGAHYSRERSEDQRFFVRGQTPTPAGGLTPAQAQAIQQQLLTDETLTDWYRKSSPDIQTPNAVFHDAAVFVQDEWFAWRYLRVTAGLRLDHYRSHAYDTPGYDLFSYFTELPGELGIAGMRSMRYVNTAPTGSLGVVFMPKEGMNLYARVGRSYREPNIHDRFTAGTGHAVTTTSTSITVPNPNLAAETGWNVDTGVKLRLNRVVASVGYFNNTYRNFITSSGKAIPGVDPVEGPFGPLTVLQRSNIDRMRFKGFEAEIEAPFRISRGFFTPSANLSTVRGDDLRLKIPVDPLYFPAVPFKGVLGARWSSTNGRYWWDYRARAVTTQDRLPAGSSYWAAGKARLGYTTHDLRFGYQLPFEKMTVTLNAGVENLGNRFYQDMYSLYDVPARGRTFVAGLRFRLFQKVSR